MKRGKPTDPDFHNDVLVAANVRDHLGNNYGDANKAAAYVADFRISVANQEENGAQGLQRNAQTSAAGAKARLHICWVR